MPTLAAIIAHCIYRSGKPFIDVAALRGGKPLTVLWWCCVASFSLVIQLIATIMVGALSGAGNFSFSDAAVHARVLDAPGISSELDPSTLPPAWVLLVIALVSGIVGGFSLNAVAGLGEEVGWRGWWATQRQGQNFWVNTICLWCIAYAQGRYCWNCGIVAIRFIPLPLRTARSTGLLEYMFCSWTPPRQCGWCIHQLGWWGASSWSSSR